MGLWVIGVRGNLTETSHEPAWQKAYSDAVLFQFSRNPQFLTVGLIMAIDDIVLFIFGQLFMNCSAKLQKKL